MSAENTPRGILFSEKYSWNLVEEASKEGVIPKYESGSRVEKEITKGKERDWINLDNMSSARRMFVLGNDIFAISPVFDSNPKAPRSLEMAMTDPGFLDYYSSVMEKLPKSVQSTLNISNLLYTYDNLTKKNNLFGSLEKDGLVKAAIQLPDFNIGHIERDEVIDLMPFILKNLSSKGISFSNRKINQVINNWYEPYKRNEEKEIESAIYLECGRILESIFLTGHNIVTFSDIPSNLNLQDTDQHNTQMRDVVTMYFEGQLLCPEPRNLRQAIKMKDNQLINEWRAKMNYWTNEMANGHLTEMQIRKEIQEANEYIEGSGYAKYLLPNWTVLLTLPAGVAAQFVPGLQGLGYIGINVGALQLHSWLAEIAVKSPSREKFRWMMISNSK